MDDARAHPRASLKTIAETLNEGTDLEPMLRGGPPRALGSAGLHHGLDLPHRARPAASTGWSWITGCLLPGREAPHASGRVLVPRLVLDGELDGRQHHGVQAPGGREAPPVGRNLQHEPPCDEVGTSGKDRFWPPQRGPSRQAGLHPQELALLESGGAPDRTPIARSAFSRPAGTRPGSRSGIAWPGTYTTPSPSRFSRSISSPRAARKLVHDRPDEAARALEEIHSLGPGARSQAMRSLIWQLRPEGLEQGLVTALTQYGSGSGSGWKSPWRSAVRPRRWRRRFGGSDRSAKQREAARRGRPGTGEVCGRYRETATLIVRDAGVGFNARGTSGAAPGAGRFGLIGMRERAQSLGGDVTIRWPGWWDRGPGPRYSPAFEELPGRRGPGGRG